MVYVKNAIINNPTLSNMINQILRSFPYSMILVSFLFGQQIQKENGIAIDGSSGLFLNPSPNTIGTGHFTIGYSQYLSNRKLVLNEQLPFSISLGLTKNTELYYNIDNWYLNNNIEKTSTLGLRLKLFSINNSNFALDLRGQFIDILSNDVLEYEDRRLITRFITNFKIFKLGTYINGGIIISNNSEHTTNANNRIIGGIGIIIPVVKNVNGIIDYQIGEFESLKKHRIGSIAIKFYLYKHLQLALGYYENTAANFDDKGLFANISISSEILKGAKRRVRTKQGLPIPPSLPDRYFLQENNLNEISTDRITIEQFTLNEYVNYFFNERNKNDFQNIPPLDMLEKWNDTILNKLKEKPSTDIREVKKELPYPPPLISPLEGSKSKKIDIKTDDSIVIEEYNYLPKPPPLESIKN